jgi:hypothetical protein
MTKGYHSFLTGEGRKTHSAQRQVTRPQLPGSWRKDYIRNIDLHRCHGHYQITVAQGMIFREDAVTCDA